jgi:hypothetical protein
MKSQHIIWQHVSLRVYINWWNGSSVAEATLLTDTNGGHWDIILLKSHFDFTKNLWCHTLHLIRNWVDRGQKVPLPKLLWGGYVPGPLVTLCPTVSDFQTYHQIRLLWFSSGYPNNRITKFGDLDEFGWVWMIQIWRASKPNSASSL